MTKQELFETGKWIGLYRAYTGWTIINPIEYDEAVFKSKRFKLIHKKHKDILEAYLEDNNVEIEFYNTNYQNKKLHGWCLTVTDFTLHYDHKVEYRLKSKPIDLSNTWCEATQEHYDKIGSKYLQKPSKTIFYGINDTKCISVNTFLKTDQMNKKNRKQVQLNKNNEWEYTNDGFRDFKPDTVISSGSSIDVEHKEVNSFNNFGLETPDFEYDLFMTQQSNFGRLLFGKVENTLVACEEDGQCRDVLGDQVDDWLGWDKFNLKPIPKPWYEDESNFPKVVMQINCVDDAKLDTGLIVFNSREDFDRFGGDYRELTTEEFASLNR